VDVLEPQVNVIKYGVDEVQVHLQSFKNLSERLKKVYVPNT